MNEYFISVVCAGILSALVSLAAYEKTGERTVKVATGLILLYTVCAPILSAISSGIDGISLPSDIFDPPYTEGVEGDYLAVSEAAFCSGVRDFVSESFSLDKSEISVRVIGFDFQTVRAEKIKIILSGRASLADARRIRDAVVGAGLGECEVDIEIT